MTVAHPYLEAMPVYPAPALLPAVLQNLFLFPPHLVSCTILPAYSIPTAA